MSSLWLDRGGTLGRRAETALTLIICLYNHDKLWLFDIVYSCYDSVAT